MQQLLHSNFSHAHSCNCSVTLSSAAASLHLPLSTSSTPTVLRSDISQHYAAITARLHASPWPLSSASKLRGSCGFRKGSDVCVGICWFSRSGRHGAQQIRGNYPGIAFMRVGGDPPDGSPGEEPPETLFMRELKRRGMTPSVSSEDKDPASSTETATLEGTTEDIDAGIAKARNGDFTVKSTWLWKDERDRKNQREKSMALNSEGLDGLIPRGQELLKLGSSFFLAFWPFIFASLATFLALYIFFGTVFIHAGSQIYHSPYVDPYKLLEDEVLPPELGPSRVPFLQ